MTESDKWRTKNEISEFRTPEKGSKSGLNYYSLK